MEGRVPPLSHDVKERNKSYIQNFVFGVEDSLVSTVGLLSGVVFVGISRGDVLTTGLILIFVEAFSMGIGSLLSNHAADEYMKGTEIPLVHSIKGGLIMFMSYLVAGLFPLGPYYFWERGVAFPSSIAVSLFLLFLLGILGSRLYGVDDSEHRLKHGFQMILIGGFAIAVGVLVGYWIKT